MKSIAEISADKLNGIKVKDAKTNELSTVVFVAPQRASGKTLVVLQYEDNSAVAYNHHTMTNFHYAE